MLAAVKGAAFALLIVAATAAALPGCGGDDGSSTAAETVPATKAGFVKAASAVCTGEQQLIAEELKPFFAKIEAGEATPALERQAMEEVVLPGFRAQYEGLRRLTPPQEDADFVDWLLLKFSRSLENGEEDLAKFFHVKPSAYSEFAEGTLMTKEYGIKGCGSLRRSPPAVLEDFEAQQPGSTPAGE